MSQREPAAGTDGSVATRPSHRRPQFIIVPTLGCPARCAYCFGPHGGPTLPEDKVGDVAAFIEGIAGETDAQPIEITLHGGEPLAAGGRLLARLLDEVSCRLAPRSCAWTVQSNLWLLDDEICRAFQRHGVQVGTSLDGPEELTDLQRGSGCFARTMAGISRARAAGLRVSCIATFTPRTAARWREAFDFFLSAGLAFSVHPAVPALDGGSSWVLSVTEYERLLLEMLEHYSLWRREIAVPSLDQLCRTAATGESRVCTFDDCLGAFLAVDPRGDVFPCQRFAGRSEYRLGRIADRPTLDELMSGPVARRFRHREREVRTACQGCAHVELCRGGCPYNAWAASADAVRDPYCKALGDDYGWDLRRRAAEGLARALRAGSSPVLSPAEWAEAAGLARRPHDDSPGHSESLSRLSDCTHHDSHHSDRGIGAPFPAPPSRGSKP